MKITSLLALFFLFAGIQMQAQGVRFGFKAGVSVSEINGYEFSVVNSDGVEGSTSKTSLEDGRISFTAGFLAEIPLSDIMSFQPEFMYSTQGNKEEALRLEYLQLPLGLKFEFNKLFVLAGPQVGLKISNFEQSDNYESLEFSAFGGLGYHITENIFVEARYTKGFSEIFSDDSRISQPSPTALEVDGSEQGLSNFLINNEGTNTYFTVSVGYRM